MRGFAFVLFASVAFGQSDVDAELAKAAKSPYSLAKFIESGGLFEWPSLWKVLGTRNEAFIRSCVDAKILECRAEVIAVGDQAIVRIHPYWIDVYLRYRREGPRWIFGGAHQEEQKYYKSHYEIRYIGAKPFFLATAQADSGTGITSQIEHWFDLSLAEFIPVLSLLKHYSFAPPLQVWSEAHAQMVTVEPGPPEKIHVRYTAKLGSEYSTLGVRTQDVVYTRVRDKFVVDKLSPTSQRELDRLYGFAYDEPSREEYLRLLAPRLRQIASGPKTERRDWLVRFLAECNDSPEKRELLGLLQH